MHMCRSSTHIHMTASCKCVRPFVWPLCSTLQHVMWHLNTQGMQTRSELQLPTRNQHLRHPFCCTYDCHPNALRLPLVGPKSTQAQLRRMRRSGLAHATGTANSKADPNQGPPKTGPNHLTFTACTSSRPSSLLRDTSSAHPRRACSSWLRCRPMRSALTVPRQSSLSQATALHRSPGVQSSVATRKQACGFQSGEQSASTENGAQFPCKKNDRI